MNREMMQQLQNPFPFEAIETKIQATSADKTVGLAVFYIDSRMIQNRLDSVLGSFNWKNKYTEWQDKAQLCSISVYNAERKEWLDKFDGADSTNIEPVKGGLSDSFKRAACMWGIGRYLYQIDGVWVEIEQRGKGSFVKENQMGKLKAAYEAGIKRIFGDNTSKQPSTPQGASNADNTGNNTKPQTTQAPQKPAPATAPSPPAASTNQANSTNDYKVHTVKSSNQGAQLLELYDSNGEIVSSYIKPGNQPIAVGAFLRNVDIEEKINSKGIKYNLINSFELAA